MPSLDHLRVLWILAFVVFLGLGIGLAFFFRFVFTRPSRLRTRLMQSLLALFATGLTCFALEFLFANVVIYSDGFNYTLASQRWMEKYWKPVNVYGLRDEDHKDLGKKVLYVVGDSIVAGYGVKDAQDRFANRLARELGPAWEFVVVADNGWDTSQEFAAMQAYPATPSLVILSYYLNDIGTAASVFGWWAVYLKDEPGPIVSWITNRSFLANWAFWKIYRGTMGDDYWQSVVSCYRDPNIWEFHRQELQRFVDYAAARHIALCVVVWPNLRAVAASQEMTSKVTGYFQSAGVPVLDLSAALASRKSDDLIVNPLDVHPNANTHGEVARYLHAFLEQQGLLDSGATE